MWVQKPLAFAFDAEPIVSIAVKCALICRRGEAVTHSFQRMKIVMPLEQKYRKLS